MKRDEEDDGVDRVGNELRAGVGWLSDEGSRRTLGRAAGAVALRELDAKGSAGSGRGAAAAGGRAVGCVELRLGAVRLGVLPAVGLGAEARGVVRNSFVAGLVAGGVLAPLRYPPGVGFSDSPSSDFKKSSVEELDGSEPP